MRHLILVAASVASAIASLYGLAGLVDFQVMEMSGWLYSRVFAPAGAVGLAYFVLFLRTIRHRATVRDYVVALAVASIGMAAVHALVIRSGFIGEARSSGGASYPTQSCLPRPSRAAALAPLACDKQASAETRSSLLAR